MLSTPHWEEIRKELTCPSEVPVPQSEYKPKFDFGALPDSLEAEVWTPTMFEERGFPVRPLPSQVPSTVAEEKWDAVVASLQERKLLDPGWLPPLNSVKSWLVAGCPQYLQHPGYIPTPHHHHIEAEQVPVALDALARFAVMVSVVMTSLRLCSKAASSQKFQLIF